MYGDMALFVFRDAGGSLHLLAAAQYDVWTVGLLLFVLQHRQCAQRSVSGTHLFQQLRTKLQQENCVRILSRNCLSHQVRFTDNRCD